MDGKRHIITIASIGPDSGQTLTLGVYDALRQADALLLRTGRHGVADRLRQEGVAFETLDALYDRTEDFDELCELAARAIIDRARQAQTLIYAVSEPQSDATVRALAQALPDDMALRAERNAPAAADAFVLVKYHFGREGLAFRIVAPAADKVAALEIYHCAHARAVVHGAPRNIDQPRGHIV